MKTKKTHLTDKPFSGDLLQRVNDPAQKGEACSSRRLRFSRFKVDCDRRIDCRPLIRMLRAPI